MNCNYKKWRWRVPRAGEVSPYLGLRATGQLEGGEKVAANRKKKEVATSGATGRKRDNSGLEVGTVGTSPQQEAA